MMSVHEQIPLLYDTPIYLEGRSEDEGKLMQVPIQCSDFEFSELIKRGQAHYEDTGDSNLLLAVWRKALEAGFIGTVAKGEWLVCSMAFYEMLEKELEQGTYRQDDDKLIAIPLACRDHELNEAIERERVRSKITGRKRRLLALYKEAFEADTLGIMYEGDWLPLPIQLYEQLVQSLASRTLRGGNAS